MLSSFPSTATASSAAGMETLLGIVGKDFVVLGADSSLRQSIVVTASNVDKIAVLVEPTTTQQQGTQHQQQQCIVAAAAGDAADTDQLLSMLTNKATVAEYEASVGCDVRFIDCSDDNDENNNNNNNKIPMPVLLLPGLSVEDVARMARMQIANQLRSATPLQVCLLIGGMEHVQDRRLPNSIVVPKSLEPYASQRIQEQVKVASAQSTVNNKNDDDDETILPSTTDDPSTTTTTTATSTSTHLQPRLYWIDQYGSFQSLLYGAHGYGSMFALSILDQHYQPNMTRAQAIQVLKDCFGQLRTRYLINAPQPPCIKCIDATGCHLV